MKKLILLLSLVAVTFASVAQAQVMPVYSKLGTGTNGWTIPVYNVIDSVIADGTVVIADTSTATSVLGGSVKRHGVRPYAGTAISRPRIVGIAFGNIRRSSEGGAGKVMIVGYHANAKMALSTGTANSLLKTGLLHGTLTTVADSLTGACGIFLGHTAGSTAANARGKVLINRPMGFFFGSL